MMKRLKKIQNNKYFRTEQLSRNIILFFFLVSESHSARSASEARSKTEHYRGLAFLFSFFSPFFHPLFYYINKGRSRFKKKKNKGRSRPRARRPKPKPPRRNPIRTARHVGHGPSTRRLDAAAQLAAAAAAADTTRRPRAGLPFPLPLHHLLQDVRMGNRFFIIFLLLILSHS